MQKNIQWMGIEYHSTENCILNISDKGSQANSAITGSYENILYKVEYYIKTNKNWETDFVEIKAQLNNRTEHLTFKSEGNGAWLVNKQPAEEFNGCVDVDISLTPFTNTLPINRLKLSEDNGQTIKVLYIDILSSKQRAVQQKYTRLSDHQYKYENIPNDFEAILSVDELGLVVTYPGLFHRTDI